jgi:hypothetical protein
MWVCLDHVVHIHTYATFQDCQTNSIYLSFSQWFLFTQPGRPDDLVIKIVQNAAQPIFVKFNAYILPRKKLQKIWLFCNLKKLLEVNNWDYLPNLVTLSRTELVSLLLYSWWLAFLLMYQGCQMEYFQTQNPDFGKFGRALKWKMLV